MIELATSIRLPYLEQIKNSLCCKSFGLEPKLQKFRRRKIAKATCRILKLDDVVVTELLHVVAHMALISPVSMSEER
jgi:hypothetical protein